MNIERFITEYFPNYYGKYDYEKDKVYIINQFRIICMWFRKEILNKYGDKKTDRYTEFIRALKEKQDYFNITLFDHIYKIYKLIFNHFTIRGRTMYTSKNKLHYTIFLNAYYIDDRHIHEILNDYNKETIHIITDLINKTQFSRRDN